MYRSIVAALIVFALVLAGGVYAYRILLAEDEVAGRAPAVVNLTSAEGFRSANIFLKTPIRLI